MFNKSSIFGSIAALALLFGIASNVVTAEMPTHSLEQTSQFRRIEQPLALKVGVTLGGLGLIGLELWWFIFSKNKAVKANLGQSID